PFLHPVSSNLAVPTTPDPEVSTLALHDALPIFLELGAGCEPRDGLHEVRVPAVPGHVPVEPLPNVDVVWEVEARRHHPDDGERQDRKSTRLNSSHVKISYAVFCLKKKKKQ